MYSWYGANKEHNHFSLLRSCMSVISICRAVLVGVADARPSSGAASPSRGMRCTNDDTVYMYMYHMYQTCIIYQRTTDNAITNKRPCGR